MKLDNKGWGLPATLATTAIILFLLLIAVYYINKLYRDLDYDMTPTEELLDMGESEEEKESKKDNQDVYINEKYYKGKEELLYNATKYYIKEKGIEIKGVITVTSEQLIDNGYIQPIYDDVDNSLCTAYVNVFYDQTGATVISPVLRCSHYRTS
jgi:hypothetical protein